MLFLFYSKSIIYTITHFFKKMSFNSAVNIMSVRRFDESERNLKALASDVRTEGMYTRLDVYIPRIDSRYSEEDVKRNFQFLNVGIVQHVDFVATKSEETKEVKFFSAFLRLFEWNKNSPTFIEFKIKQQTKLYITDSEYWFLFPGKNTITRSKVNTSQLATYMDELFDRVNSIEKNIEKSEDVTVSSTHFKNLLTKTEEQDVQIKYLLSIVQEQSSQISRITDLLFQEQPATRQRTNTIEDIDSEYWTTSKCENCGDEFDTEKQLGFHSTVCKPKEEPKPENKSPVYCEDECFFFKPLATTKHTSKGLDIESGSFSFNIDDVLGPVAKSMGITKEQAREGLQKEVNNCSRAKNSNNFCGNL